MAVNDKGGKIKSALELAMERLEAGGEVPVSLTPEQKEALAQIEREMKAGVAEMEILTRERLAEARSKGDPDRIRDLEEGLQDEIQRLRRLAEEKKEKIRGQ